jgi:hypothetical protein
MSCPRKCTHRPTRWQYILLEGSTSHRLTKVSCLAQPPDTYGHPCPQQNVRSMLPSAQTGEWILLCGPWGALARTANGLQIDPSPEKIDLM